MAADVDYSRAEIEALVLRAARGAGVPLGWAEDVALAIGAHGTEPAVRAVTQALEVTWSAVIQKGQIVGHGLAPAIVGCDQVLSGCDQASVPNDFLPAVAAISASHQIAVKRTGDRLVLTKSHERSAPLLDRFVLDASTLAALHTYAALTYVPETDASRAAGAGAGLTDND